ncbi:MAG: hypothetical protein KA361_02095 [Chromatiaceae bacterium]|nr:hypothetical protein [Chromatiaceae bacterium]
MNPGQAIRLNLNEIIDIQMTNDMTTETRPELRRRNVRTAWLLAAFACFMFLSSVPFWKGLANMIAASGL